MSTTGRAGLAAKYGGTAGPTRGAGLAGKLTPLTSTPDPADSALDKPPAPLSAPLPSPLVEPDGVPVARRRGGPTRAPASTPTGSRLVSIAIDAEVREALRAYAARTQLTHPTVALRAVQAHANDLATHWTKPATTSAGALFEGAAAPPRVGPARSTAQMRLRDGDLATLDGLVEQWSAPSRSALLNEALQRYLVVDPEMPS